MSGSFLNERVLIKIRCRGSFLSTQNRKEPTFRQLAGVLLQSTRNYKLMSFQYFIGAQLRLTSMLSLFRKFSELTYLHLEQKYQNMHILSLKQIMMNCPKLKTLKLNISLEHRKSVVEPGVIKHVNLKTLILAETKPHDFPILIKMFSSVPRLRLRNIRYWSTHTETLIEFNPSLEALDLTHVYIVITNVFAK